MSDTLGDLLILIVGFILILSGGVTFGLTTVAGIGLLYAAFGLDPGEAV